MQLRVFVFTLKTNWISSANTPMLALLVFHPQSCFCFVLRVEFLRRSIAVIELMGTGIVRTLKHDVRSCFKWKWSESLPFDRKAIRFFFRIFITLLQNWLNHLFSPCNPSHFQTFITLRLKLLDSLFYLENKTQFPFEVVRLKSIWEEYQQYKESPETVLIHFQWQT